MYNILMKKEKNRKSSSKKLRRYTLTATTAASLLVSNTYDSVNDILKKEETRDPVIEKYAETRANPTLKQRVRTLFDRLPFAVRLLVITPLYLIGWLLMLVISPLWDSLLSGILAKVGFWAVILLISLVILAVMKMILMPDVPFKEFFSRKNIIILVSSITAVALLDELLSRTSPGYVRIGPMIRYGSVLLIITIFISVFYRHHQKKTVTVGNGDLQFSVTN